MPEQITDPSDGLPAMPVGCWAFDKHALLKHYVSASRQARKKWPNSVFVDLYCGPGRVFDKASTSDFRDGGVVTAYKQSIRDGATFTKVVIGDTDLAALEACKTRLERLGATVIALHGASDVTAVQALEHLPRASLNFAFLDPFNIGHLPFSVLETLSRHQSTDMLVHYSLMDVARNLELSFARNSNSFDAFAPGWRTEVEVKQLTKAAARRHFNLYWVSLIEALGLSIAQQQPVMTRPGTRIQLYRMLMINRHPLANKLWADIAKSPQQSLGF